MIAHASNRGLGGTLRTGFAAARRDWILYSDCDLPWDFAETGRLFRAAEITGADVVSAYRLDRTGEGVLRSLYSFVYNGLVHLFLGIVLRDVNFSCKLIRRSLLDTLTLKSEGSFIDAELLARCVARGAVIQQVGLDYFPRTRGLSTLSSPAHRADDPPRDGASRARNPRGPPGEALTRLVLNADDFGLAPAHARRIAALRAKGLLTDTSLLANGMSFEAAVADLRGAGLSETGVHLCLTGGETPVCAPREIPSLLAGSVFRPHWLPVLAALAAGRIRRAEVEREWEAQIARADGRRAHRHASRLAPEPASPPAALPRRRRARAPLQGSLRARAPGGRSARRGPMRRPARAFAPAFSRASAAAAGGSWRKPGFPSRRASSASPRRAT